MHLFGKRKEKEEKHQKRKKKKHTTQYSNNNKKNTTNAIKALNLQIRKLVKETCLNTDILDFCCLNYIVSLPFLPHQLRLHEHFHYKIPFLEVL